MNKTIMLHGMNEEIKNEIQNNSTWKTGTFIRGSKDQLALTFDDGLASVYKYKDFLKDYKTILFINPFFVLSADKDQRISTEFIECFNAHKKAKENNFKHYLNSDMIKELNEDYNFEIQWHSWDHFINLPKKFKSFNIKDKFNYYLKDIEKQHEFFSDHIRYYKDQKYLRFCFPYNKEIDLYKTALRKFFKDQKKIIYYAGERQTGPWNYYEKT